MKDHIYILPEPNDIDPDAEEPYVAGRSDMPREIDFLNAFSNNLAETISDYIYDVDLFDPFAPEKMIDDIYLYFVFNYLKVLQDYIHLHVTKNADARFIILHFDYIYGHFAKTIKGDTRKIERTNEVIEVVYNHFAKNESIQILGPFDSADGMVNYYLAIKNLYYGDPTLYLEIIGKYL